MATNGEGSRNDGTPIGVQRPVPRPENENFAGTPEEAHVEPMGYASSQAGGDGATPALGDGRVDVGDGSATTDLGQTGRESGESAVPLEPESSMDRGTASGEASTEERPPTTPGESVSPQAYRGTPPPVTVPHETGHRARKVLVGVLVALTCLGMLSSALAIWMNQTLLNTDRWIQVVGPVAQNPQVIAAVSAYTADQTVEVLNVQQRVQNVLPDRADLLAGPITEQVHDFIQKKVAQGMDTPAFQRAWITVNTSFHKQIVAALRGESQYATISNGTLTIDLIPLIGQALHQLQEQGPGIIAKRVTLPDLSQEQSPQQARQELSQALGITIPEDFGQVVVVQSDQLAVAQQVVRILDILVWVLPLLTLALLIATVWLSVNRRRTLIELGIGVVVVFVAVRILIAYLQQRAIDSITTPVGHAVGEGVVPTALDSLVAITTWLFVLGFLVTLAAYLVGRRQREWISTTYEQVRGR